MTLSCIEDSQGASSFPFLKLPPELCVRILKHLRQDGVASLWDRGQFRHFRLVCHAMNDIIEKHRATIGPMLVDRLFIGQHRTFNVGPKRFVVSDPTELPKCLDSCAHSYILQAVFYAVSLDSFTIKLITDSLRQNHIHVSGMIFYGVEFTCKANLLVDLFEAARCSSLFIIDCMLTNEVAEFLAHHQIIVEQLQTHFVGSSDSFEVYRSIIVPRVTWSIHLTSFLELTLPSLSETLGHAQVTRDDNLPVGRYRVCRDEDYEREIVLAHQPLKRPETFDVALLLILQDFYTFHPDSVSPYLESASLQGFRTDLGL
ncbi:unnamed protein product [Cylicocyclus nassatus]|uniref:F-box domain-containing protein n=1 Tax=Cylicocyclus nassatus TaxID=53992 RepID=A0AA36GN10_CYLNA|nr:unnamed protein product [Cylicocyclus nassatus]